MAMPPGHRNWRPFGDVPEPDPPPEPEEQVGDLDDAAIIIGDPLLKHRFERFVGLGFTIPQSRRLALDRAVDTHEAKTLVAKGCPIHLAFDILS